MSYCYLRMFKYILSLILTRSSFSLYKQRRNQTMIKYSQLFVTKLFMVFIFSSPNVKSKQSWFTLFYLQNPIKINVIYWEIWNLFWEKIRLTKHRQKLHSLPKKSSFFIRISFEMSLRNAAFVLRQIITQLNSQPCSNWRYSMQNQILFSNLMNLFQRQIRETPAPQTGSAWTSYVSTWRISWDLGR